MTRTLEQINFELSLMAKGIYAYEGYYLDKQPGGVTIIGRKVNPKYFKLLNKWKKKHGIAEE